MVLWSANAASFWFGSVSRAESSCTGTDSESVSMGTVIARFKTTDGSALMAGVSRDGNDDRPHCDVDFGGALKMLLRRGWPSRARAASTMTGSWVKPHRVPYSQNAEKTRRAQAWFFLL